MDGWIAIIVVPQARDRNRNFLVASAIAWWNLLRLPSSAKSDAYDSRTFGAFAA